MLSSPLFFSMLVNMRRTKKPFIAFLFFVIFLIAFIVLLATYSPVSTIHFSSISFSPIIVFFVLITALAFTGVYLFTRDSIHAFLLACLACAYFLLRYFHLTQPLFLILLLAIFISLEILFHYKR